MLEFDNIRLDLESYEVPVSELKDALHIDRVSDQISEFENRMQEPDFWNNVDKATEIQQTLGRLKKKVESYNALVAEREDLLALCELANEEEDILEPIEDEAELNRIFEIFKERAADDFEFEEVRLANAFAELPLMRREVLRLLFVEMKEPSEISTILHCSTQYVNLQKFRALKRLRELLEEGGEADD